MCKVRPSSARTQDKCELLLHSYEPRPSQLDHPRPLLAGYLSASLASPSLRVCRLRREQRLSGLEHRHQSVLSADVVK